eukprot:m.48521 g.48521  ORF g.48521 m.48521 type:complete len:241 (+) comp17803_c1_seq1:346-1068(+)
MKQRTFRPLPMVPEDDSASVAALRRKPNKRRRGPPQPCLDNLLSACSSPVSDIARAMGLSLTEFEQLKLAQNENFERWAPVYAKISLASLEGLYSLLQRQAPEHYTPANNNNHSSKMTTDTCASRGFDGAPLNNNDNATPPASPPVGNNNKLSAPHKFSSFGATLAFYLGEQGDQLKERVREELLDGWRGWTFGPLTADELNSFLAGTCEEAEKVGEQLLSFAEATDPTDLFSIFINLEA